MVMKRYQTKPCIRCGESSTMMLDVEKIKRWVDGEYVQDVWPEMSIDNRELLITGTHPACWDEMFSDDDEEGEE